MVVLRSTLGCTCGLRQDGEEWEIAEEEAVEGAGPTGMRVLEVDRL